jgi:hypothetical protein
MAAEELATKRLGRRLERRGHSVLDAHREV